MAMTHISGVEDMIGTLKKLGAKKVMQPALARAIAEAAPLIVGAARLRAPNKTGGTRESLGARVRMGRKQTVYAAIGPRRGMKWSMGTHMRRVGWRKALHQVEVLHYPAKIAHLIERGHGGPRPAPPHPFLEPALLSSRNAVLAVMRGVLEEEYTKAANAATKQRQMKARERALDAYERKRLKTL